MGNNLQFVDQIKQLAEDRYDKWLVDEFVAKVLGLLNGDRLLGTFTQISTDEGDELEAGFFTANKIVDVTLSKGKIYFYSYSIDLVNHVAIIDHGEKWVLSITGEKKFDYNVVKPGSTEGLKRYESELKAHLKSIF